MPPISTSIDAPRTHATILLEELRHPRISVYKQAGHVRRYPHSTISVSLWSPIRMTVGNLEGGPSFTSSKRSFISRMSTSCPDFARAAAQVRPAMLAPMTTNLSLRRDIVMVSGRLRPERLLRLPAVTAQGVLSGIHYLVLYHRWLGPYGSPFALYPSLLVPTSRSAPPEMSLCRAGRADAKTSSYWWKSYSMLRPIQDQRRIEPSRARKLREGHQRTS